MIQNFKVALLLIGNLPLSTAIVMAEEASEAVPGQLFNERIMPIFRSSKPSSCVQCHLSSVDIKDYILPSHTDTFAALLDQGLVNVDNPRDSKILKLIRMGDKDQDKEAKLIHEKTRKAEYDAFSSWIIACCKDPKLRKATVPAKTTVGPKKPLEIVRHARKSRVVESFAQKIWSQRMRCFPCHTPHELDKANPRHEKGIERHAEFVKKYGLKMNIFGRTPEESLDRLIASSRRRIPGRYPLLNLEDPLKSLLILKPTAKLPAKDDDGNFAKPSSKDPVSHMGGLKMHVGDQSYKSFTAWLTDYAKVAGDEYVSVDDLPADNWIPTQRILRLRDVPESWGKSPVVQMFVYSAKTDGDGWKTEPVAFTQSPVTPRRLVNGPLSLLGGSQTKVDSEHFPLKPGRYLVKVCVDRDGLLTKDPTAMLPTNTAAGQAEIEAHWRVGWPKAEVFSALNLQN